MSAVPSKTRSRLVLFAVAAFVVVAVGLAAVPQLRWRVHVLFLHVTGKIPDITLREVVTYMMPGSDQVMTELIEKRNPFAVIKNAKTSSGDVASGATLFLERCSSCHGPDGAGSQVAPALVGRDFKHGDTDWAVYRTVRDGVPNTVMVATPELSETQRWQLIAYVRSLGARGNQAAKVEQPAIDVATPYEVIAAKSQPDADWLTYSGSYSGIRHSALSKINPSNVNQLGLKWVHQVERSPLLEVTPLVRNGVMFVSYPPCNVNALHAATGKTLWSWHCTPMNNRGGEFGVINRGVALLGDKIFYASSDARLFALNAVTGKEVWSATVEEDHKIYYITGAPLAYRDVVVTGTSSRLVGRCAIVAYDVNTGQERWRFHTVPGPGEPGHDTWAGDSWRSGGGPVWLAGSYDPELDLLYWGVGNPKPDYDGDIRKGDNLYTNSVVALRGTTGKLAWHFQFVPADDRDWGANQIPVLVNYPQAGGVEKRMHWGNRNGYYYSFDREKGTYLLGKPFAQATWTTGLDDKGRPKLPPKDTGIEGRLVYPGNYGATHWSSPTYYAERDLMILPVLEQGMVYFKSFSSPPRASGRAFYTAIRALNARTGELVWERKHEPRLVDNFMPGLASTVTGLVFGSDQSQFFALDANNGDLLWSAETGGKIIASPMTFEVNGEQFVTIAAGGDLLTFGLPKQSSAVLKAEVAAR
jgi:alcohol dehydrogenase (cytochrome c)